jgi:hypothetical protein
MATDYFSNAKIIISKKDAPVAVNKLNSGKP